MAPVVVPGKAPPKSEQLEYEMFGLHPKPGAPVVVPGGDGDIADIPELDDDAGGLIARAYARACRTAE